MIRFELAGQKVSSRREIRISRPLQRRQRICIDLALANNLVPKIGQVIKGGSVGAKSGTRSQLFRARQ